MKRSGPGQLWHSFRNKFCHEAAALAPQQEAPMANKNLFASLARGVPRTNAVNHEHAPAYALNPREALVQLAATGTLYGGFYVSAQEQLADILAAARAVEPEFIARTAIWARQRGYMKDTPALLCALLSTLPTPLFARTFRRVIDNGRMLRNFVQIMRSGAVGRQSLGTRPKKLVQDWLESASASALLAASVGNDPSLADVIRMVHPRPNSPEREALYAYLIGKPYDWALLPAEIRAFEAFKRDPVGEAPDVPFLLLAGLPLSAEHWAQIARRCSWHALRMNLATFARHGVFTLPGMAEHVAARLADPDAIRGAGVFAYQLLAAYKALGSDVPLVVREAVQDALEIATRNVPVLAGSVAVCPDVSGSMRSPVTGFRRGASSAVCCVDVAALVSACLLRANPGTLVLPFERQLVELTLNPRDSVLTNAARLASVCGGGTNCSAPLAWLNDRQIAPDLVVMVSDNESWVDAMHYRATATMLEWQQIKCRNPAAKLVCIDLVPGVTSQACSETDVLNIGGFSDAVFDVLEQFARGELGPAQWVGEIERIEV
jgi:60 kDa SS-A/Ro ribonucleoprotein